MCSVGELEKKEKHKRPEKWMGGEYFRTNEKNDNSKEDVNSSVTGNGQRTYERGTVLFEWVYSTSRGAQYF